MSTLDLNKLKVSLEESGVNIIEYYLIDEKCAMIKAFVYEINQFLLIYVPTKLRSEIKKKNSYELKTLDEVTDEEDYAKFDEYQINMINKISEKDSYKNLTQKYNKQIVLNGDGVEQFEKRIMRQIKRLNIPFSKLDYTLCIQNKKIMALHFGDEINLFYVKNYMKDVRCYMYIVNVKDLIENITEIQYELGNINKQFYAIIHEIICSNMFELEKTNSSIEKFEKKREEFLKKSSTLISAIKKIEEEEKIEIKKFKSLFTKETSTIRKNTLETEYQNVTSSFIKRKTEKFETLIDETYIFQIFFLLLEEISFDNYIMFKRTTTNFEKLKALFS